MATSDALGEGLAVEQRMGALADLPDGAAVRRALGDLPTAYGTITRPSFILDDETRDAIRYRR